MATKNRTDSLRDETGDPGTPKNSTFSLRLRPNEFEILNSLANLHNKSIAELAREFIRAGIRDALDPAEIDRRIEEEKQRLMAAADEMRKAVLDDQSRPSEKTAEHKV